VYKPGGVCRLYSRYSGESRRPCRPQECDSTYAGKIEAVANLAQNKDYKTKIKIFPVQIRITGQSKTLLPGLTVSCKIIVSEIDSVLFIPLESLFKEQGIEYVYLKSGSGFKRRDIKTGAINTDFAIVTEGVEENDEIALSNPFLKKEEVMEKAANGNKKTTEPR